MNPFKSLNRFFSRLPLHLAIILMCVMWLAPTLGLFATSFRTREEVRSTGWWTIALPKEQTGQKEYALYCAACHGTDGKSLPGANLSDPALTAQYPRANRLLAALRQEINGGAHLIDPPLPEKPAEALELLPPIVTYMQTLSGTETAGRFTLRNYADALVGYKGTQDYLTDCEQGVASALAKFNCNTSDLLNPEGMGRAFLNTTLVVVPATILPIFFAALAAYAFAWMDF